MPDSVTICEMSPRDGMQVINRSNRLPIEMRISLVQALQRARLTYIEVGSFVSARFLPQFEDTPQIFERARLPEYTGQLAALVPNLTYYEKFKETPNLDTVALFLSASEEYSKKNKKVSIAEDLEDAKRILSAAQARGHRARAHLSGAFRDPMNEQKVSDPALVQNLCRELVDAGCEMVALADTDGRATPHDIARIITSLTVDLAHIGVHLHDRGQAIANAREAYRLGIRTFDSAAGGIGGNKAVIDSADNIATERLVRFFAVESVETGVDLNELEKAVKIIHQMIELTSEGI